MLKDNIAALRKAAGMSQGDLAERLFVVRQTVSKWEKGLSAPDSDMLVKLAEVFGVSVGELIGEKTDDLQAAAAHASKNVLKIVLLVFAVAAFLAASVFAGIVLVRRANLLHPEGVGGDVDVALKGNINISKDYGDTVAFDVEGKPQIVCTIPYGYASYTEQAGMYTDGDGNFITVSAEYAINVHNPLHGTVYMHQYEIAGYSSYADMARLALHCDLRGVSVFSSKRDIHIAGGARLIRQALCAGRNAWCYTVDGGLMEKGGGSRVFGIALLFDGTTWMVFLEDCNDINYHITVKAPDGVGKDADTLAGFLSSIRITE